LTDLCEPSRSGNDGRVIRRGGEVGPPTQRLESIRFSIGKPRRCPRGCLGVLDGQGKGRCQARLVVGL
jgi:hypothetical protein